MSGGGLVQRNQKRCAGTSAVTVPAATTTRHKDLSGLPGGRLPDGTLSTRAKQAAEERARKAAEAAAAKP